MGTKYSSNSATGYNSTPPSDDGSVTEANKVKYATIKDKLTQPVKDLVDTINTELVTHFDNGPVVYTTNQTINATHYNKIVEVSGTGVTLTLADAATLGAGWYCWIVNTDSSNTVTIARTTGTDTFDGSATNFSLLANTEVFVFVKGDGSGFVPLHTGPKKSEIALLGSANTFTAAQEISLATAGTNLTLSTTDAGATGVTLLANHDSASPAASDVPFQLTVRGRDSGASVQDYAAIIVNITDPTAGSEDSNIVLRTIEAGTNRDVTVENTGQITSPASVGMKIGASTIKARIGYTADGAVVTGNYDPVSNTQDNAANASWKIIFGGVTDGIQFARSPAGSTTFTNLFSLDSVGVQAIGYSSILDSQVTTYSNISGASFEKTSIPNWVKRITVLVNGWSVDSGPAPIINVQIGDSGGYETTGYVGQLSETSIGPAFASNAFSTYFIAGHVNGITELGFTEIVLTRAPSTTYQWIMRSSSVSASYVSIGIGYKNLSSTLDRVKIFSAPGIFDAGEATIMYE